jgi:hypothetical protein
MNDIFDTIIDILAASATHFEHLRRPGVGSVCNKLSHNGSVLYHLRTVYCQTLLTLT